MRAYTPSSLSGTLGAVEFVIKIYFSGANESYPEGGALTQYLNQLNEGDTIDVKGPIGHIVYENGGKLIIDKKVPAEPGEEDDVDGRRYRRRADVATHRSYFERPDG